MSNDNQKNPQPSQDSPIVRVRFSHQMMLNSDMVMSIVAKNAKCSITLTQYGVRFIFPNTGADTTVPYAHCLEIDRAPVTQAK